MKISLILARSKNNVVGTGNLVPWHLKDDLKHFYAQTLGKTVVMGRRTYESIGQPLPNRENIVLTSKRGYRASGCYVTSEPPVDESLFAIGGVEVWKFYLPYASELYLTEVHATIICPEPVYCPPLNLRDWVLTYAQYHPADKDNQFAFTIKRYVRTL